MTVIEALWERLGIGKTLRDICKANRLDMAHERALLAMTANRLCEPESKLGVWERWLSKVYMPSCDGLDLDQMYEAMDVLYYNAADVERSVFFHTADLLNLQVDLIFYDTTTAFNTGGVIVKHIHRFVHLIQIELVAGRQIHF